MRFRFLLILGLIFMVVGGAVVVTHLDDTPSGQWQVVKRRGRTINYMQGGGMLIMGGTFVFVGAIMSIVGFKVGRRGK